MGYLSPSPSPACPCFLPPQDAQPVSALPWNLPCLWVWPLPWREGLKTQMWALCSSRSYQPMGQNADVELLVFWCSSVVESLCAHVGGLGSILSQGKKPSRAGLIPGSGGNPRSRKWQPIRVFLSGKFPGQRNLAGCGPWGQKELYASGQLRTTLSTKVLGRASCIC